MMTAPTAPPQIEEASPYVGPQPFRRQDSGRFFGRTQETNQLLSLVIAHRVTVLYAPSGAGKTSLLNAALLPRLEEKGFEVLPPTRVLGPAETADPDIKNIYTYQALCHLEGDEEESRNLASYTISDYLQEQGSFLDKYGLAAPRVLIFDQFEEFFTAYPARWQEREAFFQQLQDALEAEPLLRIIFSLREDYLAQLEPYGRFLPDNLRRRFRLERMTHEAAQEAVCGPLAGTSRNITDEAAEKLVAELRKIQVESAEGTITAVGPYVEPVQLQVVCQNLWQSLPDHVTTITEQELAAYGDVTQALSQFYETALRDTIRQPDIRVKEGDLRDWFEKQLITPAGTRSLLFQDNETGLTGGITNAAIHHLDREHHIIRGEFRSGSRWYELTHDRFIDPIIEANQLWREQVRRKRFQQIFAGFTLFIVLLLCGVLGVSAQAFFSERNEEATAVVADQTRGAVMIGTEVAVAQQFATATAAEQTRVVEQTATQSAINRQNATATAVAQNNEVLANSISEEEAAADPDLYLVRADTLFLSWGAEERLQSLLTLIQFEGEVYEQAASDLFLSLTTAEQEEILQSATALDTEQKITLLEAITPSWPYLEGHLDPIRAVAFSPEGEWLASGGFDQTIILWNLFNPAIEPILLTGHKDIVSSLAFSPDGQWLVSGSNDQTIRYWELDESISERLNLNAERDVVSSVAFSPDGLWLASGHYDSTVLLWNPAQPESEPISLTGHTDRVLSVAFSPDGEWLASSSDDRTIRLWNLTDDEALPNVLRGHEDVVLSVAFSPDGRWLASAGFDQTVRLWDMYDIRAEPAIISGSQDRLWSVAFSPDNFWLAAGSDNNNIYLWERTNLTTEPVILTGHKNRVWSVDFSPDGLWLASGSADHTVRLWNVYDPAADITAKEVLGASICDNLDVAQIIQENTERFRDSLLKQVPQDCIFWISAWPTESRQITQGFGENPDIYGQFGLPGHEGLDFEASEGSNIYAVADGVVSRVRSADDGGPYGNAVYISHPNGYETLYAHLQESLVEVGQAVTAGQLIGRAGNTGSVSNDFFLHFGLFLEGATSASATDYPFDIIDPTPFIIPLLLDE